MSSLKQFILDVEREFPGYRNVDLRRAHNRAIGIRGGDTFIRMREMLKNLHYMDVVPKDTVFYQVRATDRKSHFFSKNPEYWQQLRTHATTYRAVTRRPLNMLKLSYKIVSFEDYDEHDRKLATQLMMAAKLVYPQTTLDRTCLLQSIKYLVRGSIDHTDSCRGENPDYVLRNFLCRIGFDGWIRLHNAQTIKQDFRETEPHVIDEIMVCNLDNMAFDYD